jgi:hypothetical protein
VKDPFHILEVLPMSRRTRTRTNSELEQAGGPNSLKMKK